MLACLALHGSVSVRHVQVVRQVGGQVVGHCPKTTFARPPTPIIGLLVFEYPYLDPSLDLGCLLARELSCCKPLPAMLPAPQHCNTMKDMLET